MAWEEYTWIVVVGAIVCFASAWAIGTNDCANAFGTSVGAKTLTLMQACLVAGIFEFTGAVTLGSSVAATVAGAIAKPSVFLDFPEIYMYGMLCSMAAAGMWVTVATYLELAVSTTHSIIGALMGFALVWGGPNAIVWDQRIPDFPYSKGFVPVVISWFTSPLIACFLASTTFLLNRTFILRRDNSTQLAFWALPALVFKTVVIDLFFILYKGAGDTLHWSPGKSAWVATAVAGGCAMFAAVVIMPILRRRHNSYINRYTLPKHKAKPVPTDTTTFNKGKSVDSGLSGGGLVGMDGTEQSSSAFASTSILKPGMAAAQLHTRVSEGQAVDPRVAATRVESMDGSSASAPALHRGIVGPANLPRRLSENRVTHSSDQAEIPNPAAGTPELPIRVSQREMLDSDSQAAETMQPPHGAADAMKHRSSSNFGFLSRLMHVSYREESTTAATLPAAEKQPKGGPELDAQGNQRVMVGLWDAAFARASLVSITSIAPPWTQQLRENFHAAYLWVKAKALHGLLEDVHEGIENDERVVAMHQAAEIFDPETEHVYKYLQVFSACCVSFAHGSNDVANAVGPFAGIWYVYNNGEIGTVGSSVPKWILAMGGAGIVLGLSTYGYNIIRVMGVKMAKISPSRGYCAELSVAMTVAVASAFGLPISTTHCIVGAEIGVGLCEDIVKGTNWRLFLKTCVAWVATLLVAGVLAAALFAQGAYAPCIAQSNQLLNIQGYLVASAENNWLLLNQSNQNAAQFGLFDPALQAESAANTHLLHTITRGHVTIDWVGLFDTSNAVLQSRSLVAVGYNVALANFTASMAAIPGA